MKLTKGKISKLYNKKKQSLKKINKKRTNKKSTNKRRTFRKNKKINLAKKTLRRYYSKKSGGEEPTDETGMDDMMGDTEITDTEMPVEPETKEGYQTVMDSIFGESQVEKVLSGYFQVEEKETPILENKNKMDFLKRKINKITQKEEVQRLSINETQKQVGLTLIEQYDNASFIGRTTKKNLVFKINNKEVKVTPQGRTI